MSNKFDSLEAMVEHYTKGYADGGEVATEPNVADYVVEGVRDFVPNAAKDALNLGKTIFDQMNPAQQRALRRAFDAGGDMFDQLLEHAVQSPTGQSIHAGLMAADIATEPARSSSMI